MRKLPHFVSSVPSSRFDTQFGTLDLSLSEGSSPTATVLITYFDVLPFREKGFFRSRASVTAVKYANIKLKQWVARTHRILQ